MDRNLSAIYSKPLARHYRLSMSAYRLKRQISMHIESFHSILERDCYAKNEFNSYTEAHKTVTEFIDFYVNRYLYGRLKDMPPAKFYKIVVTLDVTPFTVKV